ncbi:MAG: SDR family NAD(P)-dependent oxidoreductase [Calditrichaeota bacterium]|nr:MAG: SDR family NAD(P)-dependent oxidoreductase [Calditrichota bacterium]
MSTTPNYIFNEKTALPGLAGKYGIVTGASKGMGLVMAKLLVECGARVVINGRDSRTVAKVSEDINAVYKNATLPCEANTANLEQVQQLFRKSRDWSGGKIDFLVCNAGYRLDEALWNTPLHKFTDQQIKKGFDKVREVDLDGARFCSREALRTMVEQNSGCIVFISSTPAITGYQGTPYTEAKAAILGLMRDIACEYAPSQIRANALALGNIRSGWYNYLNDNKKKELALESPAQRWGKMREVAGVVAFLVSDLAGFINGQTLIVDGGKVIR